MEQKAKKRLIGISIMGLLALILSGLILFLAIKTSFLVNTPYDLMEHKDEILKSAEKKTVHNRESYVLTFQNDDNEYVVADFVTFNDNLVTSDNYNQSFSFTYVKDYQGSFEVTELKKLTGEYALTYSDWVKGEKANSIWGYGLASFFGITGSFSIIYNIYKARKKGSKEPRNQ